VERIDRGALRRRVGALLAAAGCGLAACGSTETSTSSVPGVATNPPQSDVVTATTSTSTGTGTGTGTGPMQTSGIRTVIAPLGLNLRDQPATTGNVVGSLAEGTVLTVTGNNPGNGGWYQVKGETKSGWITADPRFSTARHLTSYSSQQHGFSTLYPDTWTFNDSGGSSVTFGPQAGGGDKLFVSAGANIAALGGAGAPGYAVSSGQSLEVFGVTGTLRIFDRGGGAAPGTSAPVGTTPTPTPAAGATPPPATPGGTGPTGAHIAEILLTVNATNAMRLDFEYSDPADLAIFGDIYNSMKIYAALPTPAPTTAAATT
jgi:hypothetical protein